MTTDHWLPSLTGAVGIKYQAIADSLETAVREGRLRGGDRLPPQRDLAARLNVDLTTVTKAYEVARQRGLIEGRGRLGSYVREPDDTGFAHLPHVESGMNMPPELPGNAVGAAIADGTTALLRHGSGARLQYQPPGGALQDRIAGAQLLTPLCGPTNAEQVVLTAGGQHALHAILEAQFEPSDAIACGRYVYSGFKALAARLRLRLVPLEEMTAPALDAAVAENEIRGLYLVPTNDNPTAHTVGLAERRAIAAVIERHGLALIEDDAYGPLAAEPLPTLTSFVPDKSWHIASTSKIISPALRVAYVRAPSVAAALRLAADLHETAIMPPPINAALVSRWIADAKFGSLVGEMRQEVAARRALADQALSGSYSGHPQGYHLWVPVKHGAAQDVVEAMRGSDLQLVAAARFAVGDSPDTALRVSLGGIADHDRILRALRTLQGHLLAPPRRGSMLV